MDVLRRNWQFRHVYQHGKKLDCKTVIVFYLRDSHGVDSTRFGVVASKRVGNAVKRNRAKRILREAGRRIEVRLAESKLWLVFIARPALLEEPYRTVAADLENGLLKEGLLKQEPNSI
ncbi:MAG: ribonuclease P protein component [Chitinivibrionia bacterium]|nr:ribonuclease P protein component [Chitinivibrionia bacterium]